MIYKSAFIISRCTQYDTQRRGVNQVLVSFQPPLWAESEWLLLAVFCLS